jgi:hypothetical protein
MLKQNVLKKKRSFRQDISKRSPGKFINTYYFLNHTKVVCQIVKNQVKGIIFT